MAVLSRQKQPSGQTSRFEPRITSSILARAISLSASEPSTKSGPNGRFIKARPNGRFIRALVLPRQKQRIAKFHIIPHSQFISGRAKLVSAKAGPTAALSRQGPMAVLSRPWPFYHGRSSQVARHPDFSRGVQISQSVYQRPGQAIFSRSEPNGRFIKAGRPDGRFIKVTARKKCNVYQKRPLGRLRRSGSAKV